MHLHAQAVHKPCSIEKAGGGAEEQGGEEEGERGEEEHREPGEMDV